MTRKVKKEGNEGMLAAMRCEAAATSPCFRRTQEKPTEGVELLNFHSQDRKWQGKGLANFPLSLSSATLSANNEGRKGRTQKE